jgi:hypothetical protein
MHKLTRRGVLRMVGLVGGAMALAACAPSQESAPFDPALLGLPIQPRSRWGAAPTNHAAVQEPGFYDASLNRNGWRVYAEPLNQILRTLVVHHSAVLLSDGPREIQGMHFRRGFADIGYHFLVSADGQMFEGRPLNVRGAHTARHNTGAVGVCLLGNFEVIQPTPAQLQSLHDLGRALRDVIGITHLAGHRDFPAQATLCPGKNLYPLLPDLAASQSLTYGAEK